MNDKLENNAGPSPIDDERISAYLDGALSDDELVDFEDLLRDNAEYRSAVEEMRQVSEAVRALPRLKLDAGFSERVMVKAQQATGASHLSPASSATSVVSTAKRSKSGWRSFVYVAATLAAALLVMALSGFNPFSSVNLAGRDAAIDATNEATTFALPEEEAVAEAVAEAVDKAAAGAKSVNPRVARSVELKQDLFGGTDVDTDGLGAVLSEDLKPDLNVDSPSQRRGAILTDDAVDAPREAAEADVLDFGAAVTKSKAAVRSLQAAPLREAVKKANTAPSANPAAPLPPSAPALDSIAVDDRMELRTDSLPRKQDGKPDIEKIAERLGVPAPSDPFVDPKSQNADESLLERRFAVPELRQRESLARYTEADQHVDFMNTRWEENQGPAIEQVAVVSLPAQANIDFFFSKAAENGIQLQRLRRGSEIGEGRDATSFGARMGGMGGMGGGGMGGGMGGAVAKGVEGAVDGGAQPGGDVIIAGDGGISGGISGGVTGGRAYGGGALDVELKDLDADGEIGEIEENLNGVASRGVQVPGVQAWSALPAATPNSPASGPGMRGRAFYFGDAASENEPSERGWEKSKEAAPSVKFEESDLDLFSSVADSSVATGQRSMRESSLAYGRQQGRVEGGEYVLVEAPIEVMLKFVESLNARPSAVWYAARTESPDGADGADFGNKVSMDDLAGEEAEDLSVASLQKQSAIASVVPDAEEDEQRRAIVAKPTDTLSATLRQVAVPEAELSELQAKLQRPFSVKKIPGRNQADRLYSAFGFSKEDKTKIEPGKPVSILFYLAPSAEAAASEVVTSEVVADEDVESEAAADDEVAPAAEATPAAILQP